MEKITWAEIDEITKKIEAIENTDRRWIARSDLFFVLAKMEIVDDYQQQEN
jgi:hypothetical protein